MGDKMRARRAHSQTTDDQNNVELVDRHLQNSWGGIRQLRGEIMMSNSVPGLRVGQKVPSFEIDIFDPVQQDFGTIGLDKLRSEGKWTILFFYPADFTFV